MSNKTIKNPPSSFMGQSQKQRKSADLFERQQLKKQIMEDVLKRVDVGRIEAMMLCFGATLAERGLDVKEIFEILDESDKKLGVFNDIKSLETFRSYIVENYGFDINASDR
jgi:hypothetical protein